MSVPNSEEDRSRIQSSNNQQLYTFRNYPSIVIDLPTAETNNANNPRLKNNVKRAIDKSPRQKLGQVSYITAIVLISVLGCYCFLDNTIYSKNDPGFKIDSILLYPPKTSVSQVSTNWTIGISVRNSNNRTYVIYDGFEATLIYDNNQNLCTAKVEPFTQGPKNTTTLVVRSGTCFDSTGTVISNMDSMDGRGRFDVTLRVRYRYIDPMFPGKNWVHAKGLCKDVKIASATRKNHSKEVESKKCRIEWGTRIPVPL